MIQPTKKRKIAIKERKTFEWNFIYGRLCSVIILSIRVSYVGSCAFSWDSLCYTCILKARYMK